MITKKEAKERLEYLRGELRAERISRHEIYELEYLALHIEPGDVELLDEVRRAFRKYRITDRLV